MGLLKRFQVELVDIDLVKPYHRNPRKNQDVDKCANSIQNFGWQQPIVVDKENVIIVGHTRFLAAKQIGLKQVPVKVAENLDENEAKAYRIADNKIGESSEWENELLGLEFMDLQKNSIDLSIVGFEPNEIENVFGESEPTFTTPEQSFQQDTPSVDAYIPSQVRMVQLFLNSETEPKFKEMVTALQEKNSINNITDAVYLAVENEYNRSEAHIN